MRPGIGREQARPFGGGPSGAPGERKFVDLAVAPDERPIALPRDADPMRRSADLEAKAVRSLVERPDRKGLPVERRGVSLEADVADAIAARDPHAPLLQPSAPVHGSAAEAPGPAPDARAGAGGPAESARGGDPGRGRRFGGGRRRKP